jgi:hypothetical protein
LVATRSYFVNSPSHTDLCGLWQSDASVGHRERAGGADLALRLVQADD